MGVRAGLNIGTWKDAGGTKANCDRMIEVREGLQVCLGCRLDYIRVTVGVRVEEQAGLY